MRRFLIGAFLGVLLVFASAVFAGGFQPGMQIPINGGCSRDAAETIAEADAQSEIIADRVLRAFIQSGDCRFSNAVFGAVVKAVIMEYKDYSGEPTQLLQVHLPNSPGGPFLYVLVISKLADKFPKQSQGL